MPDPETISVYDSRAGDYAAMVGDEADGDLGAFLGRLPSGSHLLDLGCGPGHAARAMMEAGHTVEATDASSEMVRLAQTLGVPARIEPFDALTAVARFDGVWASFSLLHAPRAEFPGHLAAIARALKPGGLLCLGMKLGDGEGRDRLGRHYTYYSEETLRGLLAAAGFSGISARRGRGKGLSGELADYVVLIAHA